MEKINSPRDIYDWGNAMPYLSKGKLKVRRARKGKGTVREEWVLNYYNTIHINCIEGKKLNMDNYRCLQTY